jgi:uncharacterized membrane protein YhhN
VGAYGILAVAAVLLAGLLWFESRGARAGVLATKGSLSILFVLTAALQPFLVPAYHGFLLAGLVLCLAGDVFLALPGDRVFLAGLVSFLLGHVFYVLAFFGLFGAGAWTLGAFGLAAVAGGFVWVWLRPHLGTMRRPVAVYILVISLMVCGAAGVLGGKEFKGCGRFLVVAGALCFYVSDLFVARDRFVQKGFVNRLLGLPLYFAGQYMLAFSPSQLV